MKRPLFIALFLSLLFSQSGQAKENCVFVVMGGQKAWISLLPMAPTDISISVDAAFKKEASKSGCEIISLYNDSPSAFEEKFKELKKFRPGTQFHLAFTDHGAPPDERNLNASAIFTGTGKDDYIRYSKFFDLLKENIPRGSHVTFSTNSCYGGISEGILASGLDSHFDICGGSSTAFGQLSWNLPDLDVLNNGTVRGPYGAVGIHYANEYKKKYGTNPNMADFHYNAKHGDLSNMERQPGLTTSLVYAESILKKRTKASPMLNADIGDRLFNMFWRNNDALDQFLATPVSVREKVTENFLTGTCREFKKTPFDKFIELIAPLHSNLLNAYYNELPAPYKEQSATSLNWLKQNQKKLASLLTSIASDRAEFIKKNRLYPREKYPKIEEEWKELKNRHNKELQDYQFHLRVLQEGKTIQGFMLNASKEEKERYLRLVECEKRPIY